MMMMPSVMQRTDIELKSVCVRLYAYMVQMTTEKIWKKSSKKI